MIGAHSSVGAVCRVHATSTAMNLLTVLLFHWRVHSRLADQHSLQRLGLLLVRGPIRGDWTLSGLRVSHLERASNSQCRKLGGIVPHLSYHRSRGWLECRYRLDRRRSSMNCQLTQLGANPHFEWFSSPSRNSPLGSARSAIGTYETQRGYFLGLSSRGSHLRRPNLMQWKRRLAYVY